MTHSSRHDDRRVSAGSGGSDGTYHMGGEALSDTSTVVGGQTSQGLPGEPIVIGRISTDRERRHFMTGWVVTENQSAEARDRELMDRRAMLHSLCTNLSENTKGTTSIVAATFQADGDKLMAIREEKRKAFASLSWIPSLRRKYTYQSGVFTKEEDQGWMYRSGQKITSGSRDHMKRWAAAEESARSAISTGLDPDYTGASSRAPTGIVSSARTSRSSPGVPSALGSRSGVNVDRLRAVLDDRTARMRIREKLFVDN